MVKCAYCEGNIPKDRYMLMRFKIGIDRGYCNQQCKNRAGTLRYGVIHPNKMPKNLDKTDKRYVQDYVNELHLVKGVDY